MRRPLSPRATKAAVSQAGHAGLPWLVLANVVVIGLIAVLLAVTLNASRSAHRQRAFDAVESLARGLERNIQSALDHADVSLKAVQLELMQLDGINLQRTLDRARALIPEAENLRVEPAEAGAPVADAGALTVTGPRLTDDAGRWVLDLTRSVPPVGDRPAMRVRAEVDTRWFERMFARMGLGGDSAISLRMADLSLVTRHTDPPTPRSGLGTRNVSSQLLEVLQVSPREGIYLAATALDGIERANAYRQVDRYPLTVLVGLATTDYLATWRNEARLAAGLALLAAAAMAAASTLAYGAWRRGDRSRRALDRERQRLRALLLTASDGLHVLARDGRLLEFSDAFATLLGRSRADLTGAHVYTWEAGVPHAEVDRVLRSFAVGDSLNFSTRYRRADGSLVDVDVAAVGVRVDGQDLYYLAARDITDRKQSLAALRASEASLDRTGRIASVGGWEFDPADRRLRLTAQALRLLALPTADPCSLQRCLRVFSRASRRRLFDSLRSAQALGRAWDLELPAITNEGSVRWLRCFAEPVLADGRTVRWVGAVQDVSERRARTAELQREQTLRTELERILKERGEMLDVLAHEVRQPLNNASAALQSAAAALLEVGEQVAVPRLGRAQTVLGQVMARIDNTLAVAALLARPGPIDREDADIDTLVAVAGADMPATERPRVRVVRETSARTASMDMSLMRLALRNLLSNALKYSLPGSEVTLRLADSERPLGLVIDVIDTGTGIPPSLLPRLFERGARGVASSAANPGASQGLGLYIVRRVMELHGGRAELLHTGDAGTAMRLLVVDAPDE